MRLILLFIGLTAALISPAIAHPSSASTASFSAGVAHPFSGLDHIAAMVSVGLWAALKGDRALWVWPVTFISVMLFGAVFGMARVAVPFVEPGILVSVVAHRSWRRHHRHLCIFARPRSRHRNGDNHQRPRIYGRLCCRYCHLARARH
jgi:hypothetical protein